MRPVLRVVRGDATAEEVAAILGALLTLAPPASPPAPWRVWGAPAGAIGAPLHPGPGAWRVSGLPR